MCVIDPLEKNPCAQLYSNPCGYYGECSPTGDNNYECLCDDHWGGDFCDEFSHCNPNPCKNDGKCVEKGNHFQCDCQVSNTFNDTNIKHDL